MTALTSSDRPHDEPGEIKLGGIVQQRVSIAAETSSSLNHSLRKLDPAAAAGVLTRLRSRNANFGDA